MSLRQLALATNLAIAHVNGLQLDRDGNDGELAATGDHNLIAWDLCKHDVLVPNLGGKGPDSSLPEVMRLPGITKANGQTLDLVVSVHEDSKASWEANAPEKNRVENCFGYTNVAAGSKVKLNFRFTKPGEAAAWDPGSFVPYFKFTVLDLDQSKTTKEEVVFHTAYDHLYLNDPHDFHYHPDETPVRFQSKSHGTGRDNPKDAMSLGPLELARSFTVGFEGKTEWDISFDTIFNGRKKKGGRNFMWAGSSDVPDAMACEEWKDNTFAWGLCDSELTTNNLGGYGPDDENDDTPEEIRYANVGKYHGKALDLQVVADDSYQAFNISRNTLVDPATRKYASLHGCYGAINVKSGSTVKLTFSFLDHETGDEVSIGEDDGFGFTVYDIDTDANSGAEEAVIFETPYAHGVDGAIVGEKVRQSAGKREFTAASAGNGKDNIYDEAEAETEEQKAKSVRVMYSGISQWTVELQANGGKEGRNFLFSGCSTALEEVPAPHLS